MARYDLVVYGATGATGRAVAAHLSERAGADTVWAIAGRHRARLDDVAAGFDGRRRPETIATALDDPVGVDDLAARSAVVVNLAGPYTGRADDLIAACVRHGAHYLDLCGEPRFIRQMIDAHHETARAQGVAVVPACGYEAVPFDLAVRAVHDAFRAHDGSRCGRVEAILSVAGARAPLTAGVAASLRGLAGTGHEPVALDDAFALAPGAAPSAGERQGNAIRHRATRRDGRWLAPLAPNPFLNPQVIQRTRYLLGASGQITYAAGFSYQEAIAVPAAAAVTLAAFARRLRAIGHGRRTPLDRLLLGALGRAGRSAAPPRWPDDGSYRIDFVATSDSGAMANAVLVATGDPGYGSTGPIIAEAALALTRDNGCPRAFGITTPALALGPGFPREHPAAGLDLTITVEGERASPL